MSLVIVISDDDIFEVLRNFLLDILPLDSASIIQGQINRIPEPLNDDFVLMIPIARDRISTNVDGFADDAYIASIAGTVMSVSKVIQGVVAQGQHPTALPALAANTIVGTQLTGPVGGVGTYNIAPSQTVTSRIMQAGKGSYLQATKMIVQLEVHGPNSADNAQIISTMMRDDYAYDFFVAQNHEITPLYADDPKQMAFSNDQQQVENRWVIQCLLQANITVQAPQQFADQIIVGLINTDVEYPPEFDGVA